MNTKERFQRTMRFQPVDRAPNIEVGVWPETVPLWREQGMPEGTGLEESILTFNGSSFFGLDTQKCINLHLGMIPFFESETLEEDDRIVTVRTVQGAVVRALKNSSNMPQYLSWAVRDREDFESMRQRYDSSLPERYPANWGEMVQDFAACDCPVWGPGIGSVGFFSMMRTWMGTENACTVFYDDPPLAREMCEFIADFSLGVLQRALSEVKMDYFLWFEDFSFKTGPLVSPSIFKDFLLPCYRRVNEEIRAHGIDTIVIDTDGDPRVLIPLLLESGINVLYPCEQCCEGMHPVALRKEYGHDLRLWGAMDKRALAKDTATIQHELQNKLPPLLADGGFIPQLDHLAPPDIPYRNWLYYLERKKELLEGR